LGGNYFRKVLINVSLRIKQFTDSKGSDTPSGPPIKLEVSEIFIGMTFIGIQP
jgi:hypothetical protein